VTVVCPVSEPAGGFVVYEDSRRDAARARLELTLGIVRALLGSASGVIVEAPGEAAARDACALLAPDELVVCGQLPRRRFGGDAAQRLERATGVPVELIDGAETHRDIPSVLAV